MSHQIFHGPGGDMVTVIAPHGIDVQVIGAVSVTNCSPEELALADKKLGTAGRKFVTVKKEIKQGTNK